MGLSSETVVAEVHRLLTAARYAIREDSESVLGLPRERCLLAEDRYGVVAVAVYPTWSELQSDWTNLQGALVEEMTKRMDPTEPKVWDGYLVLLTGAETPKGPEGLSGITEDTARVRKLAAAGENLQTLKDVERVLLPLMPIDAKASEAFANAALIDYLPELLVGRGVEPTAADVVVRAFKERQPIVETLHRSLAVK